MNHFFLSNATQCLLSTLDEGHCRDVACAKGEKHGNVMFDSS